LFEFKINIKIVP